MKQLEGGAGGTDYVGRVETMTKYVMTEQLVDGLCLCGLAAVEDDRILDELTDISIDRSIVHEMAETLTRCEVSIVHFREVVEDLLAQV